ncbi:MAG: protein translocase subunit SecD [Gaiellaceae bacterium]
MSNRRTQLFLVLAVLAALVGVALLVIPGTPIHRSPTLGLDLQGGLEVVLEAQTPAEQQLTDSDIDRSVTIIRDRIDKLGVSEPEVRKQGNNQIVVQLAGVFNQDRAVQIIGSTAQLELYKLEADLVQPSFDAINSSPVAQEGLFDLLAPVSQTAQDGTPEAWFLFNPQKKLIAGPAKTRDEIERSRAYRCATGGRVGEDVDCAKITGTTGGGQPGGGTTGGAGGKKAGKPATGELPKGYKLFAQPANTKIITCDDSSDVCPSVQESPPSQTYYYLFKYEPDAEEPVPEMTGEDLKLDGTRQDFDPSSREPIVLMQFTDSGADKFHKITRELAQAGLILHGRVGGEERNAFQSFAIVLDDEIKSFPTIDFSENPDGIAGDNGAQITGMGSIGEAKDLALVLQTGALPIEFKIVDRTNVSATLGKDSLRQAMRAAVAGLAIVALFLILFYRFLGVVAVAGLGVYAALLYAVLLLFNVTLTLPGFAGMILTIGVAADANIVIFERIKEESRAGKSVRAAIGAGYSKGFATIVDANVVTAIAALVLFAVATAGVKGFALMLLIGTAISMVTAVAATRALLGLLAGFRWFDSPRFMGAQGQQTARWLQIDFMGLRRYWFAMSGLVLSVCIGALILSGLNLGIDFRGGTQITFETPRAVAIEDVRDVMRTVDQGDAVIQGRGTAQADKFTTFQVRTESLSQPKIETVQDALKTRYGENIASGVKSVSESFGSQIAKSALLAIFVSFLLIVIYISLRFQWKFAVPVLVAIGHDVLITVGIYALLGREVTTATVAAVLTVLGYSMYDTIIIFDRIRENLPLMRRASFATIANVSIWETVRRSLATTFITLLPVGALLLFGGETLKDFAFALLIGIGTGAYSTIFIASPLLTIWKEREPEFARKRDQEAGGGDGKARGAEADRVLAAATVAAAEQPAPELAPTIDGGDGASRSDARRERRRQRRRSRPHGRAR